jgi:hypothetical protein
MVHEELKQENIEGGPGQMLNVLAFIPMSHDWFRNKDNFVKRNNHNVNISDEELIDHKIEYIKKIINKISNIITVKENYNKINREIELLCKGVVKTLTIEITLEIEYKRGGIVVLKFKDDWILLITIEYTEYQTGKNLEETKILLKEIMKLTNGFWGTIGVEFDLLDKIEAVCLYDSLFIGEFEYSKWNNKIDLCE